MRRMRPLVGWTTTNQPLVSRVHQHVASHGLLRHLVSAFHGHPSQRLRDDFVSGGVFCLVVFVLAPPSLVLVQETNIHGCINDQRLGHARPHVTQLFQNAEKETCEGHSLCQTTRGCSSHATELLPDTQKGFLEASLAADKM